MKVVDRNLEITSIPQILNTSEYAAKITTIDADSDIALFKLSCENPSKPLVVRWRIPAVDVKGVWTTSSLLDKRIRADWELPQVSSRVSVDAPVVCAFSHNDASVITVCVSDPINTIRIETAIQEEDNHLHCTLTFFDDDIVEKRAYSCIIRIDRRDINFCTALQDAGAWLEKEMGYEVMKVPSHARVPLYSTWYSYHQNFNKEELLSECRVSAKMGYQVLIIDDGWQTLDGGRGYDYTGDWLPERIGDVKAYVDQVHEIGLKVMLWYSVPFCGIKSKAYNKFKDKFLTEEHPWAPVLDPRFPEVRNYLIDIFVKAVTNWGLDGFKLDFIDDFKVYPETEMEQLNGRDTLSVNRGVELLITEIREVLVAINPDILIEFRQQYISPMLRHLGNMFRAFDCPYDSVMNRVRTTDVKILCGSSAVHSDMLTWNISESVEIAALQFSSILFSVPQLSMKLNELPEGHRAMITFYTNYWMENKEVLLDGEFVAIKPSSNYPILKSSLEGKCIYGVYEDICLRIDTIYTKVDVVNGKTDERIIIEIQDFVDYWMEVYSCVGRKAQEGNLKLTKGIHSVAVPVSGIIKLVKV